MLHKESIILLNGFHVITYNEQKTVIVTTIDIGHGYGSLLSNTLSIKTEL